jgi:hypothetical protein
MVQWAEKDLCNEQQGHPRPSRLVHLHKWWLPRLLS